MAALVCETKFTWKFISRSKGDWLITENNQGLVGWRKG